MADTKRRYGGWVALGVLLLGLVAWWALSRKPVPPNATTPYKPAATSAEARPEAPSAPPATPGQAQAAVPEEPPSPVLRLPSARRTESPEGVPGPFSGRVVSATTGQGVSSAELTFAGPSGAASTRTDEAGAFRFMPDREGLWQLASIRAEGFVPFGPDWGA